MIAILFSILALFPVSFFFYALSERLIAKHESRVGKEIAFGDFVRQTWVNSWVEVKQKKSYAHWLLFALQCSVIFLLDLDVEYLIFIYLAINGFALAHFVSEKSDSVSTKIGADRAELRYAMATVTAVLCLFGCFTLSKSTSLPQAHFSWLGILFIVPFQLAGMILFGEAPFQGMNTKPTWTESARFYVWSMLCVQLFMGGGEFFIDFHVKAALLYVAFRVAGIYFPKYQQRDLLRIGILYLFPITGLLWLSVVLCGALDGGHV